MENYLKKIAIRKIWGRYNLDWNLNEDVNILSGINGSGKSTVLDCLVSFFKDEKMQFLKDHASGLEILTNDNLKFEFSSKSREFSEFRQLMEELKVLKDLFNKLSIVEKNDSGDVGEITITQHNKDEKPFINFFKNTNIDFINTFDSKEVYEEEIFEENVKSELDRELYFLQKKYMNYQLDISKKIYSKLRSANTKKAMINGPMEKLKVFRGYVNKLFKPTNKILDIDNNQISFILLGDEKKKLSIYDLSSGEKQLLLILITFLIQDNKQSIVFMDEPEISLHFDWQRQIIDIARILNPNAQLIISTHSPAMIMNGWLDKVFNISDLLFEDEPAS